MPKSLSKQLPQRNLDAPELGTLAPVAQPFSHWQDHELNLLEQLWPNEFDYEVIKSKLPGRTFDSMRSKANRMGLHRPKITDIVMEASFIIDNVATGYLLNYWGLDQ
jgi:hypothetical protein